MEIATHLFEGFISVYRRKALLSCSYSLVDATFDVGDSALTQAICIYVIERLQAAIGGRAARADAHAIWSRLGSSVRVRRFLVRSPRLSVPEAFVESR